MSSSDKQASQSLITKKSLALSLAPPRVPPHGTAHRALLVGGDSTDLPWTRHPHQDPSDSNKNAEPILYRRIVDFLQKARKNKGLPHPHLPMNPEWAEHITRSLGVWLPLGWQNWLRDSGNLRATIDTLATCAAPTVALASPDAFVAFGRLSENCTTLRYGNHPMQKIDLFFPERKQPRGLVFFVHGGAWGCGSPWLYRLVACPFLEIGMAVAVVGYRTYPCGNVVTQIQDLELASAELAHYYPKLCQEPTELGVVVMGHSSGAHITFLMMAEWTRRKMVRLEQSLKKSDDGSKTTASMTTNNYTGIMRFDTYVGISGPYNISHHFDYEASRGLEEISPMKAACGFSREEFRKHSPALKIVDCMSEWSRECETRALDNVMPRILLVHGMEDDIVPFTSTAEAASLLRSCGVTKLQEVYLARTRHNQCVLQLMVGGQVQDILIDWLQNQGKTNGPTERHKVVLQSRL